METYDIQKIKEAVDNICNKLSIRISEALQNDYQNGKYPSLLSYEKVEDSQIRLPFIEKYLIGANTFLNQPTQYFDIFRTNRHVTFLLKLDKVIDLLLNDITGSDKKIQKLKTTIGYDQFESILFELLVAARYYQTPNVESVSFIEESQNKSPDIEVITGSNAYYVECKKYDRTNSIFPAIRDKVRDLVSPVFDNLYLENISCLFEISFYKDPNDIDYLGFREDLYSSARKQTTIQNDFYSIKPNTLEPTKLEDFALFPSPKYYKDRYDYATKSEWQGIANKMYGRPAKRLDLAQQNDLHSTWMDEISWEVAVKWKIENEEIIWKQKRLAYNLLFKAMAQLREKKDNSILHIWFERDTSVGHRKNELMNFFNRLKENKKDKFSWLIFNETELDVKYDGIFDFIEYAHIVGGPNRNSKEPMVSMVFNEYENRTDDFGVGYIYKD
jgi:hypothetical protein